MAHAHSSLRVNRDIIEEILGYVRDGATLMRLRQLCKDMHAQIDNFAPRRFDVDKLLSPTVRDVIALRQLQADLGFVFGGSRVMKFLEECDWADESDLDFFMYPGTAGIVGDHLISQEGYVYQGASWTQDVAAEPTAVGFSLYNMCYVRRVYKLRRGDSRIDLVVATQCPLQTILNFHSTSVVNGITWDKAFSVFAFATWARHEGMILDTNHQNPALSKYRARGFKLFNARVGLSHSFYDCLRTGYRWIGDRGTWLINLSTDGIVPPAIPDRLTNTSFEVVGAPRESAPGCLVSTEYRIETVCFKHSLLSSPWTVCIPVSRFADAVINCVRRRWLSSGAPFAAKVAIGLQGGAWEDIRSWDRLFTVLCVAWRVKRPLMVLLGGESATFFPLGGSVLTPNFLV